MRTIKCNACNDTGVIAQGQNEVPCQCNCGLCAVFEISGRGLVNGTFARKLVETEPNILIKAKYRYGEKVIFIPEKKLYDFGYMGGTGKAIIYNEGERNAQDSYAVDFSSILSARKKIVLASTSPRRKELLAKIVTDFEVVESGYEEDMSLPMDHIELVKFLSFGKAKAVIENLKDAIVIAGDTFISFNNLVLGKPFTKKNAKAMLTMLSGNTHSVLTGISVIDSSSSQVVSVAIEAKVTFRKISEKEINDYIATGEPLFRAGAYAIQTVKDMFVEKIEGDYDSIVGLPTNRLKEILEKNFNYKLNK